MVLNYSLYPQKCPDFHLLKILPQFWANKHSFCNPLGAYHLVRKSGNFSLKSNGKVNFWKFRSEIVEYLQRYSSFSVQNGTAETVPYNLLNFPVSSLSSAENNSGNRSANGKRHFVRLVCRFWKNPYHYPTLVPFVSLRQMVSTHRIQFLLQTRYALPSFLSLPIPNILNKSS